MHSLWSTLVLGVCVAACSDPASTSSGDVTHADVAEVATSDATATNTSETDTSGAETVAPETAVAPEDASPVDITSDVPETTNPSASHPEVRCQAHSDCQPGEVCCTAPSIYFSACVAEADCTAGQRDACLVDAQCAARRPGEWTTCCHDRGDRNYCAPSPDTCQPIVSCELIADCADQAPDVCCSRHSYYGESLCTSTFFATLPGQDCP